MAASLKILIVEDNPADAELLIRELRRAGFDPEWSRVDTEPEYLASLNENLDGILSDYDMPQFNGLRALELLKERGLEVPFIIVSGTIGEETAVNAMKEGAADYLLKDRLARLGPAILHALEKGRAHRERKQAEEALRESEHKYRHLFESLTDAAFLIDAMNGRILDGNPQAEVLLGLARTKVLGANLADFFPMEESGVPLRRILDLNQPGGSKTESLVTRNDGANIPVECSARPIILHGRQLILVLMSDITEKNRTEAQLFRAQRMDTIGTLAGGIAHDLNNVFGPIIMAVDLFKLTMKDPREVEILEMLDASAQRGAEMVKQVLFFARGLTGPRELIDPAQLVAELGKLAHDTFPKAIALETYSLDGTWKIPGNRTQLYQILLNLSVNARDAMPNGGKLKITARNARIDGQVAAKHPNVMAGNFVVLEVADTGEGIPPQFLDKIFEPFFTTKELGKGTGLGLSSSMAIVRSHGGFIAVESVQGWGTVFRVHLPAEEQRATVSVASAMNELPRGSGELILIIDDEAAIRSFASQTLEAFGYRVMTASDGSEGTVRFAQHQSEIAAVITDMAMPVMDGAATIRELTRIDPGVKIIAASGLSASGVERAAGEGVRHFLAKPFSAETMLKMLSDLLHASNEV